MISYFNCHFTTNDLFVIRFFYNASEKKFRAVIIICQGKYLVYLVTSIALFSLMSLVIPLYLLAKRWIQFFFISCL